MPFWDQDYWKGGILGGLANMIGIKEPFEATKKTSTDVLALPSLIIAAMKWTALGVGVLLIIFFLVWIFRFYKGESPDLIGAAERIVKMTPQGKLMAAVSK